MVGTCTSKESAGIKFDYLITSYLLNLLNKSVTNQLSKSVCVGVVCVVCADCMVGDVNIFFTDADNPTTAEIEVMVAGK